MNKDLLKTQQLFKEYILKDIFLYELKIHEIRLCIFLTSKRKTLLEMSYDEKMWVAGGVCRNYSLLQEAEKKLINIGLINNDGYGLSIKENEFVQSNKIDFYSCKTQRELFLRCLKYWYKGGKYISVKKEYIENMFGTIPKIRNKNIKYTASKLDIQVSVTQRKNDYLVEFDKTSNKDFEKKSEKIIKHKENKQKVEIEVKKHIVPNDVIDDYEYYIYEQREYAKQQLDEIEKEECENYFKEMKKRILDDSYNKPKEVVIFNGMEFYTEELDEYFRNN